MSVGVFEMARTNGVPQRHHTINQGPKKLENAEPAGGPTKTEKTRAPRGGVIS
jgi:hypothetical protein